MYKISISRDKKGLGHFTSGLLIRKAVRMALKAEKIKCSCSVSVMLTDDEGIQELNREYRNIDRATDVLSFPLNELTPGGFNPDECETDPSTGTVLLGDMIISVPRCELQGKEFGHGYEREVMYLSVHSVLHLLGYDHIDEGPMKEQMRGREKKIMGDE